jgi:putative PIG3 family NAD(P)H quinone oxidoreductase
MAATKKQPARKDNDLPRRMTAMEIIDGELHPCTRPVPRAKKGEVLIRVMAAGVNRPDILQRQGHYPPPKGITDIPGLEVAGVIATGPRRGDKVVALVAGGGYAEYVAVPAAHCLPVPRGLDMAAAAALPETFFTVWRNVFDLGRLQKGEWLLVHGGNSGIGTTAIQMARALGAKVIATARGRAKAAACKKLGAHHAIDSTAKKDVAAEILRLTKGRGADVVLDMLGGDVLGHDLACMAAGGRHVSIASLTGRIAPLDIRIMMQKQLTITGSTLRPQSVAVKAALAAQLKKHVWPQVEKKKIRPVIARTFPLIEAQAAHEYLESGRVTGKIVLVVSD